MRKILVIAAAGAVLAVGGTTAALAQSGADDGTQVPATAVSEPSAGTSATTSAGTETTRSSEVRESPSASYPAPSTHPTRSAPSTYPARTHDLGDDHGGHGAEPGDDHGRHHEAGDDHGGRR
ncbi:hypothetical protein [Amycolatopsis sp. NPDC051061]|uniref:hypothetical protein n=1 Tax=Amycolatopsis sp. NPDC051061 TaxID=3155042 RepID=UPI0034209E3F